MGCNCGDNEYNVTVSNNGNYEPTTPIYNITLANVGVNGYSPIVRFINETVSGFNIAVDNVTGTETSPAVPKLSYVTDQINNVNNTIANLGSTYLTRNGSNASPVVTFNGITMQSNVLYGNNSLSLRNKLDLDSYINLTETGVGVYADTFKYNGEDVLTTSSIANKLDKDGSNAAIPFTIGNFEILSDGNVRVTRADITSYLNVKEIRPRNTSGITIGYTTSGDYPINLITNDKAYYNSKEIATIDDIPDVSTKLNTDGSNASNVLNLNNISLFTNRPTTQRIKSLNQTGLQVSGHPLRLDGEAYASSANPNRIIISNYGEDITLGNTSANNIVIDSTSARYNGYEIATLNDIPTVGNGTITITQGGVSKGTFTTNQSGNTTIELDEGGGGSSYTAGTGIDITNDTISIDTSVVAQLSDIPDTSDMATETWVGNQGYLTGITSSDVITALGYTPYNGTTNPNNYVTSSVLNNYVTQQMLVYTLGDYAQLTDIPTVNNSTITFTQGGVTKGTITLNQSSNQTIALDAGGGGGVVIDDTTPSTTTVYSSQKTQDLIDALVARIAALEANINGGNA